MNKLNGMSSSSPLSPACYSPSPLTSHSIPLPTLLPASNSLYHHQSQQHTQNSFDSVSNMINSHHHHHHLYQQHQHLQMPKNSSNNSNNNSSSSKSDRNVHCVKEKIRR